MVKHRMLNSPPIKGVIREFLRHKRDPVSFQEIYEHVMKNVVLVSETPRNSVYSVLFRMQDVQRINRGKYRLRV